MESGFGCLFGSRWWAYLLGKCYSVRAPLPVERAVIIVL